MNAGRSNATHGVPEAEFVKDLDELARASFNKGRAKAAQISSEAWATLPSFRREQLRKEYQLRVVTPPASAGPEVRVAPARGAFKVTTPKALYPKGEDGFEMKPSGYKGRTRLQMLDVFDVMRTQTERRGGEFRLSPGQVAMGRLYGELARAHDHGAAPRSCIDFSPKGGGASRDFMDHRIEMGQRLDMLRKRIGDQPAQRVRRVRPSRRGSRVTIMDRRLVDLVCIHDQSVTDVLRSHGWATYAELRKAMITALGDALDRMMGPVRGKGPASVHFGPGPVWGDRS